MAMLLTKGQREAVSALAGGLVALLPAVLFAKKVFQYQGARAAKEIVKSVYLGECLKIIFSVVLFTLVFVFYKVAPLVFFITYIVVVLSHWLAPLLIANKQK
jgi:ATP synthase protein I